MKIYLGRDNSFKRKDNRHKNFDLNKYMKKKHAKNSYIMKNNNRKHNKQNNTSATKMKQNRSSRTLKTSMTIKKPINRYFFTLLFIVLNVFLILYLQNDLTRYRQINQLFSKISFNLEEFREMDISDDAIALIKKESKDDQEKYINLITFNMIYHKYHINSKDDIILNIKPFEKYLKNNVFQDIRNQYQCIFSDLIYFPIPINNKDKTYVTFDDSWKSSRTYGGNRLHEGTDIMSGNNIRGYFPVLSMSSGVVEKKGWLEQGGYRLGIRAENGAYFYYAHLYSYAPELEVGDQVLAGEFIGFMGDTGYSKVEGTVGNFDVHLHVGIYFDYKDQEVSVNPYWILRYLKSYKLSYTY